MLHALTSCLPCLSCLSCQAPNIYETKVYNMGWGKGKGWSAGAAWSPPGLDHNDRNAADQPERHESMSQGKGGYGNESARYAFSLLYKERERIKQMEEDQAKKERNAELDAMRQEIKNIKNQHRNQEFFREFFTFFS